MQQRILRITFKQYNFYTLFLKVISHTLFFLHVTLNDIWAQRDSSLCDVVTREGHSAESLVQLHIQEITTR